MNVIIIHLERSKSRLPIIELIKSKFDNIKIIDGIDGQNMNDNEFNNYNNKLITYWNTSNDMRRGKIGCYLSHIKTLEYIVENKLNNVLVLEDDMKPNFNEFPNIEIEDNIYMYYLSGFYWNNKLIGLTSIIYPKWQYTKEILDILKNRFSCGKFKAIDIEICNQIHTKFNIKLHNEKLFIHSDNFSYIHNKPIKNYKNGKYKVIY